MPTLEAAKQIKTDWNFEDADYSESISSIHPYPAKFIPEIPRAVIKQYGLKKGTAVFDPFCGSGTTLTEANRNGMPSIGVDLNPIACLISRVKTSALPKNFHQRFEQTLNFAKQTYGDIVPPAIPNLNHWFKKDIQYALASILNSIKQNSDFLTQEFLRLAFSSIIVKVSNQESDTRYAAIEKNITAEHVMSYFGNACERLHRIKLKEKFLSAGVKVINKNIFDVTPGEIEFPIGLVITSPPYPNAYEYWLYHKYRMWWLGYNPVDVKKEEIGARAHFFKKNHHTGNTFKEQMMKTFNLLNKLVIKKGKICFVVGRSIIHGEIIENADILEEVAASFKIKRLQKYSREIAISRKSFNLSHAKIKKETILVFEK